MFCMVLLTGIKFISLLPINNAHQRRASTLLDQLLGDYDKHLPPKADEPTEVQLGIYIISFYSISEQTMDYSVSMYFRQRWVDERLAYKVIQGRRNVTRLGEGSWKRIWTPDTFLRNEKRASFHEVTVNNRLLRLSSTGLLWYVIKVSATLSCPMKLHKYPLDTQVCPMMFESFGYTMDNIYFSWQDKPVEIETGLQLPQFKLQSHFLYDCVQNYTAGSFPCLEIRFILRRDIGYFLIQVYVPSMLIVILSWVSFWINVEASPARVSIGLLTVLTMTTQSAGVNASLPRVSYIKAVDVWMSMCLIFVFVGLLEYALVNVMSRRKARTVARIREGFVSLDQQGVVVRQPVPKRNIQSHSVDETWSATNATNAQNNCAFEKEKNTPDKKLDKNSPKRLRDSCHHHKWPLRLPQNETTIDPPPPVSPSRSHTLPRVLRHYYHHHHQTTTNQFEMQSVQVIATQNKSQICWIKRVNKNKNTTTSSLMNPRHDTSPDLMDGMKHAKEIDRMSRKLFPATFVLFNIFYWIVYALPYMHYTIRTN